MINNIKVRFTDEPRFFVNRKDKTVVCELSAFMDAPAMELLSGDDIIYMSEKVFYSTAKAKCSENDTFDAERGKRIALAKAESKIYRQVCRHLENYRKIMRRIFVYLTNAHDTLSKYHKDNDSYLNRISNPEYPIKPLKRGVIKDTTPKK